MKLLRPNKKWVLAAIGLALVLLILKVVLFLTAKPKVTVNYVAEYNRITRPTDYDPNNNAAPYYQKAFDAFVDMPDGLRNPYINWPADFNSAEQTLLEEWLASNSQAFEYFRIATNKPYYWLERQARKDNNMLTIMLPELAPFHELTEALIWDAKVKAMKGQFQTAFENILSCYKACSHKCRPSLLVMEQHVGLGIKQAAVRNALIILDKSKVENKSLKFLQHSLQAEFDKDAYIPDIQAENFFLYDALQRTFIDNGRGTGRLAWRAVKGFTALCGRWYNFRLYLNCFIGPTRNEMVEQIEQVIATSNQIMTKTPWQVKNEGRDYLREIQDVKKRNFILEIVGVNPESTFHLYHKTRAQTEALIATLAVFRFRTDTEQFPEMLNKLVSSGYLQSVPMDPYSSAPLVYKLTGDNFTLYSVGADFTDDDGVASDTYMSTSKWSSSSPNVFSADIVYWPVKDLNKLRYEFTFEEAEKLKAEKEAEAQRKIEEANQPD